ncbi:MAG TPA: 50S ribosomal protein L22 [Cyclobacteriaceae bacterium]
MEVENKKIKKSVRVRLEKERQKEALENKEGSPEAVASLRNVPTSTRKMRLVAQMIRGESVNKALTILKYDNKHPSYRLEKLLLSAIANWQLKNEDVKLEEADLYIKEIKVNGGRILKRLRPAPQGRAHRIRKRSNHVEIIIDNKTESIAVEAENN